MHKLVCSASKSRQLAPPLSAVDEARTRAKWSLPEYEMVIEEEPEPLPLTADERKRLAEYNARSEEDLSEMDQRDIEVRHFPHSSPVPTASPGQSLAVSSRSVLMHRCWVLGWLVGRADAECGRSSPRSVAAPVSAARRPGS